MSEWTLVKAPIESLGWSIHCGQEIVLKYCEYSVAEKIYLEHQKQLAACAAGLWRTDVENAPAGKWVSGWYGKDWEKVKRVYPLYKPIYWLDSQNREVDPPLAFAIPNPPEPKP